MISWVYAVLIGIVGFFLGALVLSLCAIARCNECRIVNRIINGGKNDLP